MPVEVRKATEADLETAAALVEEYYREIDVVVRDSRAGLAHYDIWLAWFDGRPAGCILLRPLPAIPRVGEIKRMYVRPEFRRHGAAVALLHALEDHARRSGLEWLYLDTKDDLQAAITFYRRNGFTECERYNDNPQATIFMRKPLTPALDAEL
jgi:GNAT superfamily N-acetyltransferase